MRLKPIPGVDRYFISDQGTVFRVNRDDLALEHPVKLRGDFHGHLVTQLGRRVYRLADLVLLAFIGPRPFGHRVTYRDGNRSNVNLSNLEYTWRDT
jgi:hypothetical protein